MNVPILRKTIRLSNLTTTSVSVRSVLTFDKRRVHFATTWRQRQGCPNLSVCTKHRPVIDFRYTSLHSRLVDRGINQLPFRTITRSSGTPTSSCAFGDSFFAECFKNRLDIRSPFIARYQSWRLEIQTFRRFSYQQFRVFFRAFAVDDFQHEFMFGIQGDVIPIVAASRVSRIVFVTVFLLFSYKVPLFVELNLLGVRGKKQRVPREVFRRVPRRVLCNDLRYRDRLSINVRFSAYHFPRRRVRGWRRWFLPVIESQKRRFLDVQKSVVYKSSNTAIGCCLVRKYRGRGYFFHPEHRVWGSFYSDSKTCRDRP